MATCNLLLNPLHFQVVYHVNGKVSPAYQVFPPTAPPFTSSPFNSELTPFLIPAATESLGVDVQVDSAPSSDPVHWQASFSLFNLNTTIIVNPGDPAKNVNPFSVLTANVTAILNPGQFARAGFTPINTNNLYAFKSSDLPLNAPVRLEVTLRAFADSGFTNLVTDSDPSNNVLSFWLLRC